MARIIRVTATGPVKVEPQERAVWICQCGLTQNKPYCDGSHTQVRNEAEGKLCVYNMVTQSKIHEMDDHEDLREVLK